MPKVMSFEEISELFTSEDNISGKETYSSLIETRFQSRTGGLTLEELCKSGRITDAYGRKVPELPADIKGEKEKAQFYLDYVKNLLKNGTLLFYEKPYDREPRRVEFIKKTGSLQISKNPVVPKEPKKPGWWNRRRDRKLLAQGRPGTPEMEAYRAALKSREDAAGARQEHAEHFDEMMAKKKAASALKKNSDRTMDFYLNFNKEEYSADPFTDEFSREPLENELANRVYMAEYQNALKTDPKKAEAMYHKLTGAEAELAPDGNGEMKLVTDEADKKYVKAHTAGIRDPKALKNFLREGGPEKLAEGLADYREAIKKEIPRPDVQIVVKNDAGISVPDVKTSEAYKRLCDDAKSAMDRLKETGLGPEGRFPDRKKADVMRDLAIVSFQNTVSRSIATDGTVKESTATMLQSLDGATKVPGETVYGGILRVYQTQFMKQYDDAPMEAKDVMKFLAGNKVNQVTKTANLFGLGKGFEFGKKPVVAEAQKNAEANAPVQEAPKLP